MFHLPNRVYYTTLKTLTRDQLMATVNRVLEYAALELLSLVALGIVLDRVLGLSTLRLLAFALRKHALLVQSLLAFWVMTTTQLTLEHLGTSSLFSIQLLPPIRLLTMYDHLRKATTIRFASSGYGIQNRQQTTRGQHDPVGDALSTRAVPIAGMIDFHETHGLAV
jgi:hypothetical protein